jgi:NTP pyrophosphatase (non-canonical NTP hydrolase)
MKNELIANYFPELTMQEKIDYQKLVQRLGKATMLEQLAEEACELAQAALKLSRSIKGTNPPSAQFGAIVDNLNEEIADVLLIIEGVGILGLEDPGLVRGTMSYKQKRWASRIAANEMKED